MLHDQKKSRTGVWVDGVKDAKVPGDDIGIVRGMIVFETIRTYGSKPFRLLSHLQRLERSAQFMNIPCPNLADLAKEINDVSAENVWIRISLTLGGSRIVQIAPIDTAKVGRPVDVASIELPPNTWLPRRIKHCSRASWVMATQILGTEEVIFVNREQEILEANRSNVLAIVNGLLWTPPADGTILEGVTRTVFLEVAKQLQIPIRIAPLPLATNFDELYLCSTLKELAPVRVLDGREIGGGPIGEVLYEAFRQLHQA